MCIYYNRARNMYIGRNNDDRSLFVICVLPFKNHRFFFLFFLFLHNRVGEKLFKP